VPVAETARAVAAQARTRVVQQKGKSCMRSRTKLIILCTCISISSPGLLGWFLATSLRADRLRFIQEGAARQLDVIILAVSSFIEDTESDLSALAANELVRTRDDRSFTSFLDANGTTFRYNIGQTEKRIIELFNTYRQTHSYVNSVYMGRENGSFVRSHPRERPTRYDPRERPWYLIAKANLDRVVETEAYPSVTTSDVNIGVERALVDSEGRFYGVVGMDITLGNLTDFIRNFSTTPPGKVIVVDANGTVLASQDRGMRSLSIGRISPSLAGPLSMAVEGFADVNLEGEEHVAIFRPPTPLGWRIIALIPSREIGAQIRPTVLTALLGVAASWLVLGVLILIGLHLLVLRPLARLTAETDHVARTSSLDRRIDVRSSDEIGTLAQSYNRMIDSLRQSQQSLEKKEADLREYRGHLEELVTQRTTELQDANRLLKKEIAERIMVEQALMEREAQYRDLVESANSIIIRFLPDGRLTFFNKFAQGFFGYSEEEIIGRNVVGAIMASEDSAGGDLSSLVRDIVAYPEAHVRNVNENMRRNGERVWVAWSNKAILGSDGQVEEVLSIGVDITQLVRTERELRQTLEELAKAKERSEAADRLKSAFLATMSHELRTPLNSIIGFTGILLQGMVGPLNEEQDKQLHMVQGSAQHLLSLISDVLDISKIEAGQMTVSFEPVNVQESMQKVTEAIQPLAVRKGIELRVQVGQGVGTIDSDARRMEQILLNLLSNAVKFTDKGSVEAICRTVPGGVEFQIRDTGIGISDEELARVFKPFHQVDTGLSRKYEGTGLGLSISKRLVELLGGTIRVESARNQGSVFSFSLPEKRSP
jgi:PAS domain S-box-containing protein